MGDTGGNTVEVAGPQRGLPIAREEGELPLEHRADVLLLVGMLFLLTRSEEEHDQTAGVAADDAELEEVALPTTFRRFGRAEDLDRHLDPGRGFWTLLAGFPYRRIRPRILFQVST